VPCHRVREYVYTFGAVDPISGTAINFDEKITNCASNLNKAINHFPKKHFSSFDL
jgi:hypothetical protein